MPASSRQSRPPRPAGLEDVGLVRVHRQQDTLGLGHGLPQPSGRLEDMHVRHGDIQEGHLQRVRVGQHRASGPLAASPTTTIPAQDDRILIPCIDVDWQLEGDLIIGLWVVDQGNTWLLLLAI